MTSLIIAGIVIVLVVTLLIKGFYPQAALFIGGLALLGATAAFDFGEVLSADKSTNFAAFDVFKAFCTGFYTRIRKGSFETGCRGGNMHIQFLSGIDFLHFCAIHRDFNLSP